MDTIPLRGSLSDPVAIDPLATVHTLCNFLRQELIGPPRHHGYVVGVSGGIDSAVALALCVRAIGAERVHAMLLPEKESQPDGVLLARSITSSFGVQSVEIDLTPRFEQLDVYASREAVVRGLFGEFEPGSCYRLILPGDLRQNSSMNVYRVEVVYPDGTRASRRPDATALRRLQASTNVKQRLRMLHLYREAEEHDLLVCGTTNRTELDLGLFVVHGDGAADVEPLGGLYKTQVRALARELELPDEVIDRPPAPDTWSAPVTDEEFYLRMDYQLLDAVLARVERGVAQPVIARDLGIDAGDLERILAEIARRAQATERKRRLAPIPDLAPRAGG